MKFALREPRATPCNPSQSEPSSLSATAGSGAARTVIAATRRDLDLTQEQLAERIGWTRDRVAKLESGNSDVKLPDFCVIAQRGFRMKPEDLFMRVVRW